MTTSTKLKALAIKLHEPARRHTSEADYKLMLAAAQELKEAEDELLRIWGQPRSGLVLRVMGYNT